MHREHELPQTDDRLPSDGSDGAVRNSPQAVIWNWKPNLSSLDMSHSGVTDETIANIVQLRGLGGHLDLSDTEVTDACLPLLAKTNVYFISLCDTKVTSEGLAKINWGFRRIGISPAQFTEAELKPLLKRVDILIQTPSIKR